MTRTKASPGKAKPKTVIAQRHSKQVRDVISAGRDAEADARAAIAEQPLGWRERIAAVAKGRVAVSVDEAAILLGIGRALAYREALKGSLPTFRVGRRLLVAVATLERLLSGE